MRTKPRRTRAATMSVLVLMILIILGCGKRESQNTEAPIESQPAGTTPAGDVADGQVRGAEPTPPGSGQPAPSESEATRPSRRRAPDFALSTLDGETIRLSDHRGKIVLIDFWATWCAPCRVEIPHFIELQKKYGRQGLVILGISLDRPGTPAVRSFVKSNKINYPIMMGDPATVESYGPIRGIPTTFLVDRTGHVAGRYEGYRDQGFFENEIERVLNEPVS